MNERLKEKLHTLPTQSGVYLMKDISGNIIYVGKAKNLKRRVNSYFVGNDKPIKTFNLVENIADFDYIVVASDTDAFLLENNLIKKYQPHYNILLKDGKNYPYIKINLKEDFPKLEITRKVKKDGAKYFGPYFNGISPEQILEIVARAFNLRTCNLKITEATKPVRPCLNYDIGLCSAPCAHHISKQDYQKQVDEVIKFLKGDTASVYQILEQKMQSASENLNFEKAIEIREEIKALNLLKLRWTTQFSKLLNQDVVGYYSSGTNAVFTVTIIRDGKLMAVENFSMLDLQSFDTIASSFLMQYYSGNRTIPKKIVAPEDFADREILENFLSEKLGEKVSIIVAKKGANKKLCDIASINGKEYLEKSLGLIKTRQMQTIGAIERLKDVLKLESVPYRMECYDISNISGTNSVASMVVFLNGEPAKKHYRKFNIKTVVGSDDFASMKETLLRRLGELKKGEDDSFACRPNLIVVDGGKGQLSSVCQILSEQNENIAVCSLAKQDEEIFVPNQEESIKLKRSDVALQVLQRIRDEAHRFAITFHRSKRTKAMTKSVLDDVKGIGKVRKKELLNKFGSLENIKNSSLEELMLINGVTEAEAKAILEKLNK